MRVCLDARCLRKTVTGLGRYAEQLIRGLAAIDRTTDYVVILAKDYECQPVEQASFQIVRFGGRPDTLGNVLGGARKIAGLDADIFHSLHHFLPFGVRGRTVLTLHDFIWLDHPDLAYPNRWKGRVIQAYASLALNYALRRANHIIAISEHTARRARERMAPRIPEISVIPHGVDERFHRAAKRHASGFATTEAPFFLVVGNSKPNKNVARIVGAMALLVQKVPEVRLRIVGRGEGYRELRSQVDSLGLTQKVDFFGNVPDEELLDALQRAVALVFPSLVEGFGMPVLEAQAVGCPVITSDRGVLPETAGDAALFVDPYDAWDIARAMETLYRDLPLRESLVRKGRERATRFTWEETAKKTRHVYDLVMGQSLPEFHAVRQVLAPAAAVQA